MKIVTVLGLLATGFALATHDLLLVGLVWVVGQFSPSTVLSLLIRYADVVTGISVSTVVWVAAEVPRRRVISAFIATAFAQRPK